MKHKKLIQLSYVSMVSLSQLFLDANILFQLLLGRKSYTIHSLEIVIRVLAQPVGG
jgi:hypothetical protein